MKKTKQLIKKLYLTIQRAKIPRFLHRYGPKKYTTRQHLICVFLKQKLKLSWRELLELLPYFGITEVPDHSTLVKFCKRMTALLWTTLLQLSAIADSCLLGAIDSTGLSKSYASRYFVKRIDRKEPVNSYVKLSFYTDLVRRKILSLRMRIKHAHDIKDTRYLVGHSPVLAQTNLMDKAYDCEGLHAFFREKGVLSIVPTKKNCRKGLYRKQLKNCFPQKIYNKRSIAESVNGAYKRKYGDTVMCRKFASIRCEVYARAILFNLFSLLVKRLFHQSHRSENVYKLLIDICIKRRLFGAESH